MDESYGPSTTFAGKRYSTDHAPVSSLQRCTFSGETSSFCCLNRKLGLEPLPALPLELEELFRDRRFVSNSRRYNHRFAFSALGIDGEEGFMDQPAHSCVKIQGRTYQKISGNTLRWLIHDPLDGILEESALRKYSPRSKPFLEGSTHLSTSLRHLGVTAAMRTWPWS